MLQLSTKTLAVKNTLLLIILSILALSCKQAPEENTTNSGNLNVAAQTKAPFDWLVGDWKRTKEEEGKATNEFWEKVSDIEYSAIGFTLENADTVWQERMHLLKKQDAWVLAIRAPEDPAPVFFEVTSVGGYTFTCENPKIEFPKKIKYWKSKTGIAAAVSNSEVEIPFQFEPLKE